MGAARGDAGGTAGFLIRSCFPSLAGEQREREIECDERRCAQVREMCDVSWVTSGARYVISG